MLFLAFLVFLPVLFVFGLLCTLVLGILKLAFRLAFALILLPIILVAVVIALVAAGFAAIFVPLGAFGPFVVLAAIVWLLTRSSRAASAIPN